MEDNSKDLQLAECTDSKLKTVAALEVHLHNNKNVQIGNANNIIFLSSKEPTDSDENANETDPGEFKTEGNQVVVKNNEGCNICYNVIQGKTIVSVGDTRIVEIYFKEEVIKRLLDSGQFSVSNGEGLVSVIWSCDQNQNDQTITELKINFLHTNGTKDTADLEKEILNRIRSEEELRQLITELISVYKAKLKHINTGCIEFVLSTDSKDNAKQLENKTEEIKELLKRTIIPHNAEIEIKFNTPIEDECNETASQSSNDSIDTAETSPDAEEPEVETRDTVIKPQRASRVLSTYVGQFDNTKDNVIQIRERKVGALPKKLQTNDAKIINSDETEPKQFKKFTKLPFQKLEITRNLFRGLSQPNASSLDKLEILESKSGPTTAPIGFEGMVPIPELDRSDRLTEKDKQNLEDDGDKYLETYKQPDFTMVTVLQKAMETITSYNKLVLYGNRGCGKTTALVNIIHKLINTQNYSSYKTVFLSTPDQLYDVCVSPQPYFIIVDEIDSYFQQCDLMKWAISYEKVLKFKLRHKVFVLLTSFKACTEFSIYQLFKPIFFVDLNDEEYVKSTITSMRKICPIDSKEIDYELTENVYDRIFSADKGVGVGIGMKLLSTRSEPLPGEAIIHVVRKRLLEYAENDTDTFVSFVLLVLADGVIQTKENDKFHVLCKIVNEEFGKDLTFQDIIEILAKESKRSQLIEHDSVRSNYHFLSKIVFSECVLYLCERNGKFLCRHGTNMMLKHLHPKPFSPLDKSIKESYDMLVRRFADDINDKVKDLDDLNLQFLLDPDFLQILVDRTYVKNMEKYFKNGQLLYHFLLQFGSLDVFHIAMKENAIYQKNETYKRTLLHFCLMSPFATKDKVILLHKTLKHFELDVSDADGNTPLHLTAYWGHYKIMEWFFNYYGVPCKTICESKVNTINETVLSIAIKRNHKRVVQILLENGVDVDNGSGGEKPLDIAAANNLSIYNILLEHKANAKDKPGAMMSLKNNEKQVEIMQAVQGAIMPTAPAYTTNSAEPSADVLASKYPIHFGIKNHYDNFRLRDIIHSAEDLNIQDENGDTALHIAVQCNDLDAIRLLNEQNADLDCENTNSDRPLHIACLSNKSDIVTTLIDYGASTHCVNVDGNTPLHLALRYNHHTLANKLIQQKQFLNKRNKEGNTALHVAAKYSNNNAIRDLVQAGASLEMKNNHEESPLLQAVKRNNIENVRVLLDNGANINTVNDKGDAPLHVASQKGLNDVVNLLANNPNIDLHIANNARYTALHYATDDIRQLLMERGCRTSRKQKCTVM